MYNFEIWVFSRHGCFEGKPPVKTISPLWKDLCERLTEGFPIASMESGAKTISPEACVTLKPLTSDYHKSKPGGGVLMLLPTA